MKILIDECLPVTLRKLLPKHEVFSTEYMGWKGFTDANLLKISQQHGFNVFLTADRHIGEHSAVPQNMAVLIIPTNRIKLIQEIAPQINESLEVVQNGKFHLISFPAKKTDWAKSRFISEKTEQDTVIRHYKSGNFLPPAAK